MWLRWSCLWGILLCPTAWASAEETPPPPSLPEVIADHSASRLLLQEAQQLLQEAAESAEEPQRVLREKARLKLLVCRPLLKELTRQTEQSFRQFPVFIAAEELALRDKKRLLEMQLIQLQLDQGLCEYRLAQTAPQDSVEQKESLTAAFVQFDGIHSRYRSQVGGLYARLMQGRCAQELGQIGVALGLYEELLEHREQSPALVAITDRALQYRLNCLNGPERRDYILVEQEASAWLQTAGERQQQVTGQGIRWELCVALEQLGLDSSKEATVRTRYLERAHEAAQILSDQGNNYVEPAGQLIDRVQQRLNGQDPAGPTS